MGILDLMFFSCSPDKNVIWLGVSRQTLHFMSCACKGCKPTSEIKTFEPSVKQKILNDENVEKVREWYPFMPRFCVPL